MQRISERDPSSSGAAGGFYFKKRKWGGNSWHELRESTSSEILDFEKDD